MKRAFAALAAGVVLAGAAVAQEAPKAAQQGDGVSKIAGDSQRWHFGLMTGGAMGWENNSIVRDDEAKTAEAVRFAYFAKERASPKPYSWLFQNIKIDCAASTMEIGEEQFIDKRRNLVAVLAPSGASVPITTPTDKMIQEVMCEKRVPMNTYISEDLTKMMDAIEKNATEGPVAAPAAEAAPEAAAAEHH